MVRVKHRVASKKRKKRTLKAAKGYWGGRSKLLRTAKETVLRADAYAYIGRKLKKRSMRALWIARINAACRAHGIKYAEFIDGLKKAKVDLDRKVLADLAVSHKTAFKKLIDLAKPKKKS
ncbi:MAG: 50S ribosomal protein L20 [Candidatus Omnitrophica bacterium]|nr:50S ribosomal protein L20 [Candidatus Omnitrophota bacterium]